MRKILQPAGWTTPKGYTNGLMVKSSEIIFIGGQIGWNERCEFESDDFVAQTRQALLNIVAILADAGATPQHIARMTWYITDKAAYLSSQEQIGLIYREVIGRHFPPMSVVQVLALVEDRAKVEIEATAVR
jgi:enamine deaminase RidA (YjgF/YER057c/UK114 family)